MLTIASLLFATILIISVLKPWLNPGLLAFSVAYLLIPFLPSEANLQLAQLFPSSLFLTLLGVTLFFSCLNSTGTIEIVIQRILKKTTSHPKMIAYILFAITSALTASGIGNIATVALIAPLAIPLANKLNVSKLAMTILIVGGANAASFSPLCLPGIVVNDFISKSRIAEDFSSTVSFKWIIFVGVFFSISAATGLSFSFIKRVKPISYLDSEQSDSFHQKNASTLNSIFTEKQAIAARITILLAILFLTANFSLNFKDFLIKTPPLLKFIQACSNVSVISWMGASVLLLFNVAQLERALKHIPWSTLLMVTGMSTFIELLTQLGFARALSQTIKSSVYEPLLPSVFASSSAVLSAFSSSVGVALPTFMPLIEGITSAVPSANPKVLLLSLAVGSHIVDASPLSTLGALCLAQVNSNEERAFIYKWLLIYSFCMIPIAGLLAFIFSINS